MLSFLNKSKKPTYTDKVWKTEKACIKGAATEALNAIKNSRIPVVFFFFQDAARKFTEFLEANELQFSKIESDSGTEPTQAGPMVFIADAFRVGSNEVNAWLSKQNNKLLTILFLGHYPVPAPELEVLDKLNQRVGPLPAVFCLSLEDALLQNFGSERIKPLMETLGMKDDECIEHAMVSRAILNAREKLATQVKDEMKAKTELDWFVKNVNPVK